MLFMGTIVAAAASGEESIEVVRLPEVKELVDCARTANDAPNEKTTILSIEI